MHREVELVVDLIRKSTLTFATHRFGRNNDSATALKSSTNNPFGAHLIGRIDENNFHHFDATDRYRMSWMVPTTRR